ncbi:hypothetical protein BO71DRAFT_398541 [Aspergillus ellipticus CBS 707.79]|uniref:Uncharacterized protein n=1 Tax=Aspergillus ellipticus CBS 707.79 TaxID=1448320 RepID=A0A319EUC0_9EURO|nr:hypothetical protein BO71DRAFT_398541 [Aspergillus ellipticus CBS 707.79]
MISMQRAGLVPALLSTTQLARIDLAGLRLETPVRSIGSRLGSLFSFPQPPFLLQKLSRSHARYGQEVLRLSAQSSQPTLNLAGAR